MNQVEQETAESAPDFLSAFAPPTEGFRERLFRGHSSSSYELVPTALREQNTSLVQELSGIMPSASGQEVQLGLRENQIHAEKRILTKFYAAANRQGLNLDDDHHLLGGHSGTEFPHPQYPPSTDLWPQEPVRYPMGLAQHYGLPTRMLDWTRSHFAAAYFAAKGACEKIADCLAKEPDKLDEYLENNSLHVWSISGNIDSSSSITIVSPRYFGNPNLRLQSGALTLWMPIDGHAPKDTDRRALNQQVTDDFPQCPYKFSKHSLSYRFAPELLSLLRSYGYEGATLFAGYDGVARGIEESALLNRLLWALQRRSEGSAPT